MIQSDLVFIWIVQETSLLACVVLRNSVDARKNSNIKERYCSFTTKYYPLKMLEQLQLLL
jgi:hypothetical protein